MDRGGLVFGHGLLSEQRAMLLLEHVAKSRSVPAPRIAALHLPARYGEDAKMMRAVPPELSDFEESLRAIGRMPAPSLPGDSSIPWQSQL